MNLLEKIKFTHKNKLQKYLMNKHGQKYYKIILMNYKMKMK